MEFPHLGQHCSESTCNKLDFLPMKCDSCDKIFCSEHFNYDVHSCPGAHRKNFQVPVCPLCGEPVPTPRGVQPDQTVGEHIDKFCKSDTKKIYTNRCTYKTCKKKELIPVQCGTCKMNFCLRHRHTSDHECKGPIQAQRNAAAVAAEARRKPTSLFTFGTANSSSVVNPRQNAPTSNQVQTIQSIQGNMVSGYKFKIEKVLENSSEESSKISLWLM
uniref:AN1-type domain-containing protein n=1 Tax=Megaselia scalaris TaxID=36166 RepID=T1GE66_MEGSC